MVTTSRYLEAPQRLRAYVRAHETSLVVLATLIGTVGGLVVAAMSIAVEGLHVAFFNLEWGDRLSSQFRIEMLRPRSRGVSGTSGTCGLEDPGRQPGPAPTV